MTPYNQGMHAAMNDALLSSNPYLYNTDPIGIENALLWIQGWSFAYHLKTHSEFQESYD